MQKMLCFYVTDQTNEFFSTSFSIHHACMFFSYDIDWNCEDEWLWINYDKFSDFWSRQRLKKGWIHYKIFTFHDFAFLFIILLFYSSGAFLLLNFACLFIQVCLPVSFFSWYSHHVTVLLCNFYNFGFPSILREFLE